MPNPWSIIWFSALAFWDYIVIHSVLPDWLFINPPESAPECWLWSYGDWLWRSLRANRDARGTWTGMMLQAASKGFERLANWARDNGRDWAISTIRGILGNLAGAYSTFAQWLTHHDLKIGGLLPWWASNLIDGLNQLWDRIPAEIRNRVLSWSAWIDGFLSSVRTWAMARYDQFKQIASQAWSWITASGEILAGWWRTAHAFLDDWRLNWWSRIVAKLGSPWTALISFAQGSLQFWYNLWSAHGSQIGGLLSNPFQWLYDRLENWILERIW